MLVCRIRSTNKAPLALSNSYFTGSPPIGTSMSTLTLCGGLAPAGIRSIFMMAGALVTRGRDGYPQCGFCRMERVFPVGQNPERTKRREGLMNGKALAEFIGTFWLVLGGCGSAVLAAAFPDVGIGLLGVALAF